MKNLAFLLFAFLCFTACEKEDFAPLDSETTLQAAPSQDLKDQLTNWHTAIDIGSSLEPQGSDSDDSDPILPEDLSEHQIEWFVDIDLSTALEPEGN